MHTINLFNGGAAAGAYRQHVGRLPQREFLICHDVLSVGPLSAEFEVDSWCRMRTEFWTSVPEGEDLEGDVSFAAKSRDLYTHLLELASADEIRVWAGRALSDQLLVAFIAHVARRLDIEDRLTVAQLGDGARIIRGLGDAPSEVLRGQPGGAALSEDQIAYASEVWQAACAATPERLLKLRDDKAPALPYMHTALNLLVTRYPDAATGLSAWDEIMLGFALPRGRKAAMIIAKTITAEISSDDPLTLDTVGDLYLYYRLRNLARPTLAEPLMTATSLSAPMRSTEYALTEFGASVQAGERNAIDVNGIDDWVGGVHLSSDMDNVWLRENGAIVRRTG